MQKHKTLIAIVAVLICASLGFAYGLDQWILVRWDAASDEAGPYYSITDAHMTGLEDSSILYPIPPDAHSLTAMMVADTGTTSVLVADDDSVLAWANLLSIDASWSSLVLLDGIADSLISAENADSFASWGTGIKIISVPDTFTVSRTFAPADSAAVPKIIGHRDFKDYAYLAWRIRVTDSTGIGGKSKLYFRFNSE